MATNQTDFKLRQEYLDISLLVVHDKVSSEDVDLPDIFEKTFTAIILSEHFTIHHSHKYLLGPPCEAACKDGWRAPSLSSVAFAFAYQVATHKKIIKDEVGQKRTLKSLTKSPRRRQKSWAISSVIVFTPSLMET